MKIFYVPLNSHLKRNGVICGKSMPFVLNTTCSTAQNKDLRKRFFPSQPEEHSFWCYQSTEKCMSFPLYVTEMIILRHSK